MVVAADCAAMESQPSPHLHPLNQAAEFILRKLDAPRVPHRIAVIHLALVSPRTAEERVALNQWDSAPKWQRLALLILEKHLTKERLLAMKAEEAGGEIARLLVAPPE